MKETKTAISFAWLILAFYVLYAIFGIGFNGLLFSMAVGLITYSVHENILIVAATTIIAGIVWRTIIAPRVMDTFVDVRVSKDPSGKTAFPESRVAEIVKRVTGLGGGLQGVGSSFAEGFADVTALDAPRPDAGSISADKKDSIETGSSKPATVDSGSVSTQMTESIPSSDVKKEIEKTTSASPVVGMQKNVVPDDKTKDGFHVDTASTLLTALNNLNPKQMEAMTNDTRALLETQKSLMGMLQSMKPLLSDGQQMMGTFQDMFGSK